MADTGVYIPSIDAKDIYLAGLCSAKAETGYDLHCRDGTYNLRRFINSFDYSLDLMALKDCYYKKFRRKDFSFQTDGRQYSTEVINLTFKYSVKEWNQVNRNTYIRPGYDYATLVFEDGVAQNDAGKIVGVKVREAITNPNPALEGSCFSVTEVTPLSNPSLSASPQPQKQYSLSKASRTLKTNGELRTLLYKEGFLCEGRRYIRFKRSSGSARTGKCLFIHEPLYAPMFRYSTGGLRITPGQEIDLAAFESYLSLTASSLIGTLPIKPENILVIDDYESNFQEEAAVTREEGGLLHTGKESVTVSNSIWDGQSLIDVSSLGEYAGYGMVLLRNLMFKSCCFNCNIGRWFADNGITQISQLNGYTLADRIEDIKLITTPKSIKYLKFDSLEHWLKHLYPVFGVVKHDKKTHFFEGKLVQTHYQLLNTLQLSQEEAAAFLAPAFTFAQMLRDNPAFVRYYIKYPDGEEWQPLSEAMNTRNEVVYQLMGINDSFSNTRYYREFLIDLLRAYYKNLKNGHVLVGGTYATLLGNPVEMLEQAIGTFNGRSRMETGAIHSIRFPYGRTLLGTRSPHVTMGNLWLPRNRENTVIDTYFNLTEEIVCLNSIGENVLQRLSGADFDSDAVMLTDNEILIRAAEKNYALYRTPTCLVTARKVRRFYTPEEQADLDIRTSVNLIGEIVNLSQELNSLLWDRQYHGASYKDTEDLYHDICQLDVLSGIEIDKAKKEFDINSRKELHKIREKYKNSLTDEQNRKKTPHFFAHVSKQKGYYNPDKKAYCKYHTSMDYLHTCINGFRIRNPYKRDWLPFSSILDKRKFRTSDVNDQQIRMIYELLNTYISGRNRIYSSERERSEKASQARFLKEDMLSRINSQKIGFSTMFRMLSDMEEEQHGRIKNALLDILFKCANKSFYQALISSAAPIAVLEPGGNTVRLFGLPYGITEKRMISEPEDSIHTKN